MKQENTLFASLEGFVMSDKKGKPIRCKLKGYDYIKAGPGGVARGNIRGERFDAGLLKLTKNTVKGDIFQFSNIQAICPGDAQPRTLNAFGVSIK